MERIKLYIHIWTFCGEDRVRFHWRKIHFTSSYKVCKPTNKEQIFFSVYSSFFFFYQLMNVISLLVWRYNTCTTCDVVLISISFIQKLIKNAIVTYVTQRLLSKHLYRKDCRWLKFGNDFSIIPLKFFSFLVEILQTFSNVK